jgi:hypothetical protein
VHFANQLALSPHAQVISGAMDVNALSYTLDDSAAIAVPWQSQKAAALGLQIFP